jgi:hypothetical protein
MQVAESRLESFHRVTSAFKKADPVQHFNATAKLGEFRPSVLVPKSACGEA